MISLFFKFLVYHITKDGWKHIKNEDCDEIYDRVKSGD